MSVNGGRVCHCLRGIAIDTATGGSTKCSQRPLVRACNQPLACLRAPAFDWGRRVAAAARWALVAPRATNGEKPRMLAVLVRIHGSTWKKSLWQANLSVQAYLGLG